MKDSNGRIIYVGKAKILKNRVRSYFQSQENIDEKTKALVRSIDAIDYIVTTNEVEALILEASLIREYKPKYNVRLKDDKRYPYLKLTMNEDFPRICLTRNVINDGAEYFGPYSDAGAVRKTMEMVKMIFRLRDCPGAGFRNRRERECLNYQIGRCLGPCTGKVGRKEYMDVVRQVRMFLLGHKDRLEKMLDKRMRAFSGRMRYEDASVVRDQIRAIRKLSERQYAVDPGGMDEDVISISIEGKGGCAVLMRIREGRILSSDPFMIPEAAEIPPSSLLESFIQLYYSSTNDIPPLIYSQVRPDNQGLIMEWLSGKAGRKVRIRVPTRGNRRKLIDLAEKNASMRLLADSGRKSSDLKILGEVKKTLGLPATPFRVETFDISNIQGESAVGSMVTFENGKPVRSGYRHFKIRDVEGIDDFAMMKEVLVRRLLALKDGKSRHPDLLVVDGGKGQVSAALKAMSETGVSDIPLIGLAKRNEEIYLPGRTEPLVLSRKSEVLKLLQRMRDEAHRFAVEYHRKLRSKKISHSELDDIEGIGERKKILLLSIFGSLERIKKATKEEIMEVPGFGERNAERIIAGLRKK